MSKDISPCPFCGGKAKLSFKNIAFYGKNALGDKKIKYRVQVIYNRCHSRGKPIKTDWLINPNPYTTEWGGKRYFQQYPVKRNNEMFRPYVEKAVEAWNARDIKRQIDVVEIVRCRDCIHNSKNGGTCEHICIDMDENFFCADGERKKND